MKKKVFSLMMTLLLAFMGVAKAETIEIGTGSAGTTYYVPFNSLYGYSFTEQVFLASEIGAAGNITSISFNLGQSYSSEQTNQIALYMKNVSRSSFSSTTDYEAVTAGDIVYSGLWTIPANYTGWVTVTLDTPFAYDGTSNLLVAMHESTSGYSTRYFTYDAVTNGSVQWYSDSYNPDPYNLGSYSGSSYTRNYRSNIQLEMTAGGGGEAATLLVHDGTATNSYVPVYGFYADAYLKCEMVYPAAELSAMNGGTINGMTFYATSPATEAWTSTWQVFVSEVADATISSFYGPGTVVYEGTLDGTGTEMTINFTTPYQYNGGNLLVGVYNIATGNYKSVTWAGESVTGAAWQGYNYSSLSAVTGSAQNFLPKTNFDYVTAGGGSTGPVNVLFALQENEQGEWVEVDTVKVGTRPNGAWMEPFTFQLRNDGPATTVTNIDWTPNNYFTLADEELLPLSMAHNAVEEIALNTGDAGEEGEIFWQMVAIYGEGRTARVWDIMAETYNPAIPDVWELACEEATTFPFVEVPATAHNTTLHNDYTLPFPEIPEGYDAVYKLTFDEDQMLSAEVTSGADGKVALYTEDFYGEGGPMANNNYTGLNQGGAAGGGAPFEAMIGDETSTTTSTYFPFHSLWNYSLAENLFLASELTEAGVTTSPMSSLSWYVNSTTCTTPQNGISIWMANVDDAALTTTSHLTAGMTLVYTGTNVLPVAGQWNEFEFNSGSFAWDGHSNILIVCQRLNGAWQGSISWKTHNPGFAGMSYAYTDNAPGYDATTQTYSMSTSATNRPNIVFKSNGGRAEISRDVVTIGDQTGYDYYYYPVNMYFNYSFGEQIYTADEIGMAGTINSISFYYNYTSSFSMDNLTLYMKNTDKSEFASTTDMEAMSLSDIVWSGNMSASAPGWVTINLDTPFQYDGTSNLLVGMFDGTSGYPGSSYKFYTHTTTGSMGLTWYSDSYTPDPYNVGSWSGSTNRTSYVNDIQLNITAGGGTGNTGVCAGPVITNLGVTPGTYYLVASSTDPDFEVTINAEDMPCPMVDAEGFAFNPTPADDEDEVEPGSVTLRWMVPEYATGWRLVFGSTYYPDPNHPQTVIYPEDGSFTNQMANSYTVRNLWNNTNYFWHVEFNNDGCPDGVSSPIWGFTTHLNIPQNLTAEDYTVFNDEQIVLHWNAVVDRTYRNYFIYRDGVKIGETQVNNINATTYTDGPLAYNMGGYEYYVTAIYDEGESAPSDPITVKVSGRGNVDGHVYEQDGTTGIANATVTMVGTDEFNVNHTYNFTTNAQGYYSGAVYAGSYNGQAACDGYQTIYEPVQGNPIDITYNVTTSPVDYILDENFDAPCGVIAEYFPDSLDPNSPYVKVYWGCGLPGSDIIEDFETGDFSMFDWQVDPTYPWSITTYNPYEGTYCMKSGGAGVPNVVSNMTVDVEIPADGLMSFMAKISCENSWDYGYFYIDGVQKGSFTGAGQWVEKTYEITAGTHTFQWRYTKDSSVNSNDDCFYVDYINFYKQPEPAQPGMTYTFEDGTMQGWTSVDADGDGYGWYMGSEIMTGQTGNNGSSDFVLSQSYYMGTVLYPDNYLVSPMLPLGGVVTFYACAQDASYAAEHFGVAVSTTNMNPSSFTMLNEWTMTAKDAPAKKVQIGTDVDAVGMGASRDGNVRAQGNWYQYTVDLSAYAGQTGYVAIRHFNCSDMFYLNVDDITITEPGKGVAEGNRSLNHYRVYRTNCYNDGPYTEDNTVLLSTVWVPDTVYIDVEWADLEPGVYKWGVGAVYEGNRGEMIESPINWAAPVAITRDVTADNDPNPVPGEEGDRAPWDLMMTFSAPEGGHYGVAYDGNNFYTSNWGYSAAAYNFYKYDLQGNMLEGFNISGCGTLRGMTYDGTYFYGVANSATVYCVDLANHSVVSTFTSAYGAQRGITYDPQRDGFWVIGNWSGNLTLIDRTGAIQFTGPAPTSASDLAYYKDENGVEHIYCFNNGTNDVDDYNITTNTMVGSVFNFNANPSVTGTSGGCTVANFNDKMAFIGDIQQSPNFIAIYELREGDNPGGQGGNTNNLNQLALPRESETIWSNCLDKDMYLNEGDVTVNVLLNSADNPEGIQVTFTNYNEYEQETYGGYDITLDETGYYEFESFRKGEYKVNVTFEGYEPIEDSVSIWEPTDLRYVMIEIIYGVSDLYVSSTGWAMWGAMGTPGGQGGGQGGNGDTFDENFDAGIPAGWTTLDADGDGLTWVSSANPGVYHNSGVSLSGTGHNASEAYVISGSYANQTGQALHPDNYLVTPQVNLTNGSSFSFWACAQDASWAAEHFGVAISSNGTSDWTMVNEWTMTAKANGAMSYGRNGETRAQGNWYNYTVDLSSYAGQKYIAIRHFNCTDQFILNVDDIALTNGAKNAEEERHLESFKVMCTSIDGEPIYNANVPAEQPFCQLATEELVPGDHYICKVAAMYSTGMSDWTECEWQYIPCTEYAGTVNGVTIEGNEISWEYPGGGGGGQGGQGSAFSYDFESGLPAGWNVIDGNNDGYTWCLTSAIPTTWTYYASLTLDWYRSGTDAICSGSYINGVGALNPDEYLVSEQVNLVNGSTFSFWAAATDASYAADHFGVFVSDNGTSGWEMVNEWTLTGKGGDKAGDVRASRDGNGLRLGTWHNFSVDLSAYAGQQKYIAIRHFNCTDQYIMCVDDIELTDGAKANRNPWDLMMTFSAPEGGHYGVAYDGNNFYTSNWGYSSAAHNFYKYDLQGNMLEGFEISGCGTLRGITYDGTYFYGVANSSTVYCVDLANHSVVSTFTSAYGAMRGITYDPARDGFWVIGNWSGNLTLIDRTGAVQFVGPEPTSASDLAYYKDENDVEHVFCFNNGDNGVYDYNITTNTLGGAVFNFNSIAGVTGTSGGCTVGSFNDKIVFIGDSQQSPNLIAVCELRDDDQPVPPTPTGDILGAMIFADGEWEAFVEYPTNTYTYEGEAEEVCVRMVYNGTNNLPEGNIYFSMSCPECEPYMPGFTTCEPGAPIHAEMNQTTDGVKIWWGNEPQAPINEWLYYFDENATQISPIGAQGSDVYWGIMVPAGDLTPYVGTSLTKVSMYQLADYNSEVVTVNIFLGGTTAPQTLVSTMNYTPSTFDDFEEVTLTTPVPVDGTQNLWITVKEYGAYPALGVATTGNPNARWISLDGISWEDVASYNLNYDWLIMGFVTNEAKGGEVTPIDFTPGVAPADVTLGQAEMVAAHLGVVNRDRAELVKYNVYRSADNETYEFIGDVDEDGSGYYEYIDMPEVAGTYYYQVKAYYSDDCESDPAPAFDNPANDYVMVEVALGVDENGGMAIFPNPTKGNVTIQAAGMQHITVVSVLGQVVYDADVTADEVILNMSQYSAGMYTVRVMTENGMRVERISVVR